MDSIFSSLVGAVGGGGLVGTLVLLLIKHSLERDRQEREQLALQVARLETEKIAKLEHQLDQHLESANPRAVAIELEHLAEALRENTSLQREAGLKIARIDKELASSIDRIAGLQLWLASINDTVQHHLTGGAPYGK